MATKEYEEKRKGKRTRNWTFLIYPESVPEDWRAELDNLHVKWCESPLHDKDVNEDKTLKKSHIHILLCFTSVKTFEQVKIITDSLNSPIPQMVNDVKALIRYFCHIDHPNKYQYSPADIMAHGGFDIAGALKANATDRYASIKEMMVFVKDNNIVHFSDLVDYALENRYEDWFPLLCDNCAYVLKQYINSIWRKWDNECKQIMIEREIINRSLND